MPIKFKLGRKRPKARGSRLFLKNYLKLSLPSPPASVDYSLKANTSLRNIYDNDTLGDCVIAGMGHVAGVLSANVGEELVLTNDQVISLYSAIGGYVPGDESTDNGCNEQDALNYWQGTGLFSSLYKISGYLAVNPSDPIECRLALWLFENLVYGVELPDAWVNPMPSGDNFTWDSAGPADPNNGHCFVGVGYDNRGIKVDTWGMLGTVTDKATALYAGGDGGELYSVLSIGSVARASLKAPSGFNWTQLVADFDSIGAGKIM